jgi:cyanophycinase
MSSAGPFLIGGGREPEQVLPTHRPFLDACGGGPIACLMVDDGDGVDVERWTASLDGEADVRPVVLRAGRPIVADDVAGAAGVFVAGGLTPLYAELLSGWAPPRGVPYAGFSAGAVIAARAALVGGWEAVDGSGAVCSEDAGEDLDAVTVRPGLGLVDFAVDVHAAQWGTLSRLVYAVEAGLVAEGWALDEGALLVDGAVVGPGAAWHVTRDAPVRRVTERG